MNLLQRLNELQSEHGWLSKETLRAFSESEKVPLYRLQEVASFYPHYRLEPPPRHTVQVCRDAACLLKDTESYSDHVRDALVGADDVEIHEVSCLGRCEHAPAIAVDDVPLEGADPSEVAAIVNGERGLPANEPTPHPRRWPSDPYRGMDERYGVLRELLEDGAKAQAEVPDRLQAAGLRGMGGAGFPTGLKWRLVRDAQGDVKHAIVNADESEPGTFKDRVILEELPHLVIEGLLISLLVTGAKHGVIYIRHEYAKEEKAIRREIGRARRAGWLEKVGAELEIFVSPGGYILGEETALLEALEGKRGEPRNKPPYPVTDGLFGQPTVMNNVETYSFVPLILREGPEAWKAHGVGGAEGWKFLSLCGDVNEPGVYCVPLGTTVRTLIEEHGGGMRDGLALQAFSPGGASAPFLPPDKVDTPLDFDAMAAAGSMLGSGAVLVVAEDQDLLRVATNMVRFFRNESCGKCVPCRVGSTKAVEMLEGVLCGRAKGDEIALLEELDETLRLTSICGLGQVALNPVTSALRHFPEVAARFSPEPA